LTASPWNQFNVVQLRTQRDILQRQRIAGGNVHIGTRLYFLANLQILRGQYVTSFAITVLKQGNAGGTVGIVFQ
jgi:hypothetical protein